MQKLAEQILLDIIKNQMSLDNDRAFVRDQNVKIPPDDQIFVIAGILPGAQVMGVATTPEVITITPRPPALPYETIKEVQQVIMMEDIKIDILSRNEDAIFRRWEIIAALASTYSQQKQEENSFKIFKVPSSFLNTSGSEGGSNLNKFSITVACQVWYRKEYMIKGYDYYDDFNTRVDDEISIGTPHGIIEFEIKGDSILGGNS